MQKRLKFTLYAIIFSVLLSLLSVIRSMVFYDNEALTALSGQYYKTVEIVYPRGNIMDKNGISFNRLYSGYSDEMILTDDSYPGVAMQIIGRTQTDPNDTTAYGMEGINGINLLYDELLRGGDPVKARVFCDANGNIITSSPVTLINEHPNEGCNITLTIDYILQKETEEIIAQYAKEKGYERIAVTITDSYTGEIVCMAGVGSEMNLNVLTYQPGSVMKIIACAAALEEGLISGNDPFICHGEFMVGDEKRYCSGKAVHGKITMKEAFASSCNEWAYEINKLLCTVDKDGVIYSRMLDLARSWGFCNYGQEDHEFILEYDGHYSFVPEVLYNEMDIFNSALGQGNIQSSVYLINKITSAIANGGKVVYPYVVSEITDPAGNVIYENEDEEFSLGLGEETVSALGEFMRCCCTVGSAKGIKIPDAAGKTGTAENISGKDCHSWFTGYFPAGGKNYAMTVFIENGSNAPRSAVPLWEVLAENVLKYYGCSKIE